MRRGWFQSVLPLSSGRYCLLESNRPGSNHSRRNRVQLTPPRANGTKSVFWPLPNHRPYGARPNRALLRHSIKGCCSRYECIAPSCRDQLVQVMQLLDSCHSFQYGVCCWVVQQRPTKLLGYFIIFVAFLPVRRWRRSLDSSGCFYAAIRLFQAALVRHYR